MSKTKKYAWVRGESGVNIMLYGDSEDWWISYNGSSVKTFGSGSMFLSDSNSDDETAICSKYGYHILKGDWRKDYEKLLDKGLNACLKFYAKHPSDQSYWSNELPNLLVRKNKVDA